MTDSLEQVGTFNRIRWPEGAHTEEGCHWIGKMVEWYFDYGQSSYNIIKEECDDGIPTEKNEAKRGLGRTILKVIGCAFKALSLLTVVIPLVILIGKMFYRADNIFVIKPKPVQDQSQDDDATNTSTSTSDSVDGLVHGGGGLPDLSTDPTHGDDSSTSGVSQAVRRKTPNQLRREFFLDEVLSEETINRRVDEYDTEVNELSVQSFADLEHVRVLFSKVNDQVVRTQRVLLNETKLDEEKNQNLLQGIDSYRAVLEKLKIKLNKDPYIRPIVKVLETAAKERGNDENLNNYIKAVGVLIDLTKITEGEEPYDVLFYEQVKARIQPTPIKNCGNSCYMNSDLQLLLSIPAIKELLLGEFKQIPIRDQEFGETNEEYQKICASELKSFNTIKEYLKYVKPAFVEFVAAVESKNQTVINKAAEKLRDATYDVGRTNVKSGESAIIKMIEDAPSGKKEQMQPEVFINILLNAAGYALRTRRHAFADDAAKVELKVCSEEIAETMITLPLKSSVRDEKPYAYTLQGLIDHKFTPMTLDDDWKIDEKPVKKDVTLLQEAPEYLFVQIKRFATEGYYDNIQKEYIVQNYKLDDSIMLDNGEQVDFSIAMDKNVTDQDEGPFLYEVVGMIQHHGGITGGHYTANVKKGGEWQNCNDSSVTKAGAHPQNIEKGYLYAFRRIPKGSQVDV